MKKIFACDRFASDENNEYSLADVTPEEYLRTMLSCVDGGILCIAKREDAVSIELAENLSSADFVVKYTFDLSEIDAAAIVAKEQSAFSACREIARKHEGKKKTLAAVKALAEKITSGRLCGLNVLNRAQRLEKLLELGAPELVVMNERRYFIEAIALNAFAVKRAVIERDDFLQAFGAC